MEIKALLYNKSGWPAKVGDKLSFKYFIDISEIIKAGYTSRDITISTNYNQGAKVSNLMPWNEAQNIYYVNVDFSGTKIYPGGQPNYRKEVQFRMSAPEKCSWDNSNDFSYKGISTVPGGTPLQTSNIPVYDDNVLVYGNTPDKGDKPAIIGDVNNDGEVNILDYIALQKYIMNPSASIELKNSDLNGDGRVNTSDLFILRRTIIEQ